MNLKDLFFQRCSHFNVDEILVEGFWYEIEKRYSQKNRHYHNLTHLENMFSELKSVENKILHLDAISFSVFYHDIIYDATSKSNEEKSAEFAKDRLERAGLHANQINEISKQIIATKLHQASENTDINYLLDADLSILGKDDESYLVYTKQIRKEYSIYPDFLYQPGRKKVLHHFLNLDSIFKTDYFKGKYEVQARKNIGIELKTL